MGDHVAQMHGQFQIDLKLTIVVIISKIKFLQNCFILKHLLIENNKESKKIVNFYHLNYETLHDYFVFVVLFFISLYFLT